jgi:hypothetical protein
MKKLLTVLVVAVLLLVGVSMASARCTVSRKNVARGVVHEFVDVDCNGTIDIVQEWRWNGAVWVTTRWWKY